MEIIITIILILISIILYEKYVLKNKTHKENKFLFTFRTILKGLLFYSLIGCFMAYLIIVFFIGEQDHPHSMTGLLYVWLGLFGAITGSVLGLILALSNKANINKKLVIYSPLFIIIILLWLLIMEKF